VSNLFIGDYVEVLKVMSKRIGVDFVLIERKNINSEVHHYCIEKNIQYELVDNASDLNKFIKRWNVVFVASFGLLLKSDFINSCQIIFNFHPGNVFNCRGRHPLPVAIKRGDQSVAVSIHLIDSESIDLGALFSQYFIALDYESSYAYNYKRLLKSLSFLTEQL
jgi:methionyl-tRNA formyltransferase